MYTNEIPLAFLLLFTDISIKDIFLSFQMYFSSILMLMSLDKGLFWSPID